MVVGNAAKLYCVQHLAALAASGAPLVLLDMGCGAGRNFIEFLDRFPNVRYVGVDPHAPSVAEARRNLAGRNAELHDGPAETFTMQGGADAIVSFSVFEHVRIDRRQAYLDSVRRNLRPGALAHINYDAGHFTTESTTDPGVTALRAARQWAGQLFRNTLVERFGTSSYYQRFVPEAEFLRQCAAARLAVQQSRSFNTGLKLAYRHVRDEAREEFMARWLSLESWMNEHCRPYNDSQAAQFTTRAHILGAA